MAIGNVAAQAGVNVQTVRYYERRGLLEPPRRSAGGFRQYTDDAVPRIRFIRKAQELGFTLEEIGALLALRVRHGEACGQVNDRAAAKIELVQQKLRELERMKRVLEGLVEACRHREATAECPILEALEGAPEHG